MNFANLKIATRLSGGFALMVLFAALVGGAALLRIGQIQSEFHTVMHDRFPKVLKVNAVESEVSDSARALRDLFIISDPAQLQALRDEIAKNDKRIGEQLTILEGQITSPKGVEIFGKVKQARSAYLAPRDKMLDLLKQGLNDQAREVLLTDLRPKQTKYIDALHELIDLQDELTIASGEAVGTMASQTQWIVGGLVLLCAVLGGAIAWWTIRSTVAPINEAVRVAKAVSDGNLAVHFDATGQNETGQLLTALHEMKTRLSQIVGEVRQGSESVATASAQIAQGNQDLSHRTEQQAASLQETTASMSQLGDAVRHNADNASQAHQLATGASDVAVKGGEVVGRVVDTMRGIDTSSRKIADIISVIDGIAFQTNILALNAAVEAARAGEQGRGFAVVAGEVRSLAQRSAEAAKEIKTLISDSVERVAQGTELVDQAGSTMNDIVVAIKRVTDLMGEINHASMEQTQGMAQVSNAVNQMDQVTQQNAALVEQSAAAAESLRNQADHLVQAVAVFQIEGRSSFTAQRAPAPPVRTASPAPRPAVASRPSASPAPRAAPAPATATTTADANDWESF